MKKLFAIYFSFTVIIFTVLRNPAQVTQPQKEDDVVKITTSLVQLDAIVTDSRGNPVTNLTKDDFEILQDGKVQKILNLSFVSRTVNSVCT